MNNQTYTFSLTYSVLRVSIFAHWPLASASKIFLAKVEKLPAKTT